jgi:6-phosphogluconolactonase
MFRRLTHALAFAAAATIALAGAAAASPDAPGAVYALTNASAGNAVLVYERGGDGSLTPAGSYPTGGAGTGAGLGSQGAVIVSDDHRLLFAVNAGSNTIASFRIRPHGLEFADAAPSGGTMPTSVAFRQGLLYVLNAGVPNTVSGFTVNDDGRMMPLAGSTLPLSAASTMPGQVGFSDDGETLIVTERGTNQIDTYAIGADGTLTGPFVHASSGPVPFGFAVDKRNTLLVSEAGAGGGGSSYRVGEAGALEPISSMIMTGQRAACWAVVTKNGRFGYVTNAGTGNISGFAVDQDGSVSLLDADGVTAVTGGNPTDAALSHDSRYLYVRVGALAQIAAFSIGSDGSLEPLAPLTGTPAGLAGLAAW